MDQTWKEGYGFFMWTDNNGIKHGQKVNGFVMWTYNTGLNLGREFIVYLCNQQRFRSALADAQADLSLHYRQLFRYCHALATVIFLKLFKGVSNKFKI